MKGKRTGLHRNELYNNILHYANFVDESEDELNLKDMLDDYKESFKKKIKSNNLVNK